MLRETELSPIMAAVQEYVVALFFGDATLNEETACKFGAPHGVGDRAAGRVIFSLVTFILDRRGEDIIAFQQEVTNAFAALAGKPKGALQS